MVVRKPTYSFSRQAIRWSHALAWLVIYASLAGALLGLGEAVEFARIAVPSMIVLIASLLGIHRFSGAMDMKTQAEIGNREPGQRPDDLEGM